jgi:hypothetical protein
MGYVSTVLKIQAVYEEAGIQFIDDDETGGFRRSDGKAERKRSGCPTVIEDEGGCCRADLSRAEAIRRLVELTAKRKKPDIDWAEQAMRSGGEYGRTSGEHSA